MSRGRALHQTTRPAEKNTSAFVLTNTKQNKTKKPPGRHNDEEDTKFYILLVIKNYRSKIRLWLLEHSNPNRSRFRSS